MSYEAIAFHRPRRRRSVSRRVITLTGLAALVACAPAEAIVGGTPAPAGQWPWMAAVLDAQTRDAPSAQYCGGIVIGRRRVLTAAHCVMGKQSRNVDVLVGRTRLSTSGGRRIHVSAISVYPGFASGRQPSLDAAVVELAKAAGVRPLALARGGQESAWPAGTLAWTMGWGQLNARPSPAGNDYYADRLRELEMPIQGDAACENAYGIGFPDFPYRPDWVLCAGTGQGGTGACYGDSGAPLVVDDADAWLDVGTLSGGDACAARFFFRWRRLGDRSRRILGHSSRYRLRRADARHGVGCSITAANRGGRNTIAARPLRPARRGPSSRLPS